MVAARERLNGLRSSRHAPRTVQAYASDWADFEGWCGGTGRASLPADPETVALYLSHLLPLRKVSTLARRLSAISSRHLLAGFPAPVTPMVRSVMSSVRRVNRQKIRRKAAISIDELLAVSQLLAGDGTLRSLRNRAVLLLGFACGFRRSDLCLLDLADIDLSADRVTISLARGKTDQEGRGRQLVIPSAVREGLCPVRALAAWVLERGRWPGALFTQIGRGDRILRERMEPFEVRYALIKAAGRCGLEAGKFGAHSLRAGFVTASADAGADVFDIMSVTGHKSVENLAMYVRRAVSRYPLRAAL